MPHQHLSEFINDQIFFLFLILKHYTSLFYLQYFSLMEQLYLQLLCYSIYVFIESVI